MCMLAAAPGRPNPRNISTLGRSPDLIYFAAHMCMLAAAVGRANLCNP